MGDRDYFRQEFTGAPREPFWATYPATKGLIIGLIGVHLLLAILKAAQVDTWLAVYTFLHLDPEAVLNRFYVWQLFTYAILHGSVMHLLLNCVMLYFLGRLCEQRMGKKRFISFCALAALAASMAFLFWMVLRTQLTPMVGASGIAMGLTVLAACWYPRMTILFFFVIPMQLWVLAALLVVVDLMQALSHTSDIAHTAHLGGALYGFIYFRYGKRIEGVKNVVPTLVFINSCRANLDLVTLHGVEGDVRDIYDMKILAGDFSTWKSRSDGALVGERLAARRGVEVGDRLQLENIDLHVTGIVRSTSAGIDNLAFMHIDQLALARKRLGAATQFMVTLEDGADPADVAARIDAKFAPDEARTDTKSMQAFVAGAVGEIAEVVEFARMLGYLAVAVVALILANTIYISAQSRAAEMGVLETIGLTKTSLAALVAAEGVGLGLVGGIVGTAVVLGFFWVNPITLGVEGYGIDYKPSFGVAFDALVASLLVGAAASIGPAIEAARRPLHQAVRAD